MPIEVKQKENPIYCSVIDFAILASLTLSTQLDKTVSTRMNCATWTKKRLAHFSMTLWLLSRKEKKSKKALPQTKTKNSCVAKWDFFFVHLLSNGGWWVLPPRHYEISSRLLQQRVETCLPGRKEKNSVGFRRFPLNDLWTHVGVSLNKGTQSVKNEERMKWQVLERLKGKQKKTVTCFLMLMETSCVLG